MVGHSVGWYEILVHYWLAIAYLGGVVIVMTALGSGGDVRISGFAVPRCPHAIRGAPSMV